MKRRFAFALAFAGSLAFAANAFAEGQAHGEPAAHGEEHAAPAHGAEAHGTAAAHGGEHGAAPAHGAEHGSAHGGHHAPPPINWADFSNSEQPPYLALLINFAVLIGLYVSMGKKPIAEGLKQRRIDIAKHIDEADALLKASEARLAEYNARLENVGHDAKKATLTLEDSGRGERDRLVREAEERAVRMQKDAAFLVEQEGKHVRQQLVHETAEVAVARAMELLSQKVTKEDHQRLADEFLENLSKRPAATSARAT